MEVDGAAVYLGGHVINAFALLGYGSCRAACACTRVIGELDHAIRRVVQHVIRAAVIADLQRTVAAYLGYVEHGVLGQGGDISAVALGSLRLGGIQIHIGGAHVETGGGVLARIVDLGD